VTAESSLPQSSLRQPSFRLAADSDTETLLGFMQAYYIHDGHPFDCNKAREALIALLRDPSLGRVWLILDGGTAAGYIVICFGYSLEWLGRDAFVDEFYLADRYRGRGWGRKSMEFAEEAARNLGVTTIHLEVVRKNDTALRIYAKLGFKAHMSTLMSKWIAADRCKAS
jgi:diamine N-acetyltransferase